MFALSLYTITHKFILSLFAHKGKYKGKKISQQDITECGNRRTVLKEYRRNTYTTLLTSGRLNTYLADIDKQAQERMEGSQSR